MLVLKHQPMETGKTNENLALGSSYLNALM